MVPKKFRFPKSFGSQKVLVPKKSFGPKKILIPRKFGSRTNFDPKIFEAKKIWCQKFWVRFGWVGWVRLASSRLGQVSRLGWSYWSSWVDLE